MKKLLFFILTIFFTFSSPILAEGVNYGEVSLESYLNDFNVPTLNTKKQEKFKTKGASDFQKKESNDYKNGNFSITSKSQETKDSKYLLDGIDQRSSLNYETKKMGVSVGTHTSYTNEYASNTTREVFFSPKYNHNDQVSIELNNYLDTKGDYFTQELGLKYKPKILKNGSVGVSGGTKFYKNSTRSEKLKFSTEFYLF